MKHTASRGMIFSLRILLSLSILLILTGLFLYAFFPGSGDVQFLVPEIMTAALACLLMTPVAMLSVLGYGYFRTGDYKMTAWIVLILFFIISGTYILFLIKKL